MSRSGRRTGPPGSRSRPSPAPRQRVSARNLALDLLLDFERDPSPVSGPIEQMESRLSDPRERHLARALVLEVLRHRTRLDWLVSRYLTKGTVGNLPAPARNVLRLGAAQAVLLERIPPHAIVSSSVDLARGRGPAGLPGLVNAVLRKITTEGRALWASLEERAPERPLPEDRSREVPSDSDAGARLALRYSHPRWLVDRWCARWGESRTESILRWDNSPPDYWLRLAPNTAPPAGSDPGWIPGTALWPAGSQPGQSDEFRAGEFTVQDGSAILVGLLPPQVEGCILDTCAAPGTKTSHLVERAGPGSTVVALDRSWGRLRRLRTGLARLRRDRTEKSRLELAVADSGRLPLGRPWQGVLVDAPCSNLGVLRRRVDARWRVEPTDIPAHAAVQSRLLEEAAGGLEPGGWLVYSVCTVEPEETTAQRRDFLARYPDWEPIEIPECVPAGARMEPGELFLLPGEYGTDGTYAFALRRPGTSTGELS